MSEPVETAYFVHISDTHIGPTADFTRHGHHSYACARRVVEIINRLPQRPDFVIHTGDVVYDPDPAAYRLAAQAFAALETPIYYVTGNHDRARDITHFLPMGPREELASDRELLTYTFDVRGYHFLVVDARGPDEIDPHGIFSAHQLQIVREQCEEEQAPTVIFTHYPILPLNSVWMDTYMLTLNGPEFHDIVTNASARPRAIFHGHVHQNMQTVRDGVLYVSTASVFSQFAAWPDDVDVRMDPQHPPAYSFVHMLPQQMIVHQHTFERPLG